MRRPPCGRASGASRWPGQGVTRLSGIVRRDRAAGGRPVSWSTRRNAVQRAALAATTCRGEADEVLVTPCEGDMQAALSNDAK